MRSSRAGLIAAFLSLIGIGVCAYLAVVHIGMLRGELLGGATCGAAGSIFNCHAVTASPLGNPFGIPLAFWGLAGYLATLSLGCIAWQFRDWSARALTCLTGLAIVFVLVDLALLAVMLFQIRYLCPLCLSTYLVNVALLVTARLGLAQPWNQIIAQTPSSIGALLPKPNAPIVWVFWATVLTGVCGTLAVHAATTYLAQGAPGTLRKQMLQFVGQQHHVTLDTTGDPQLGPPNGPIKVVEFSDFLCPSCQRAWKFNPILFASHRQDLTFSFKHFPLDMECNSSINRNVHPGSCRMAAASECAQEQGKFWAFHDLVFEQGPQYQVANLERDAAKAGLDLAQFHACVQSGRGMDAVKRDVSEGIRLGITSTPTYIINGIPIAGALPPSTFEELLHAMRQTQR